MGSELSHIPKGIALGCRGTSLHALWQARYYSQNGKGVYWALVYLMSPKGEWGYYFRLRGFFLVVFQPLEHSYKVGKRLRLHLLHSPTALNLHRTF